MRLPALPARPSTFLDRVFLPDLNQDLISKPYNNKALMVKEKLCGLKMFSKRAMSLHARSFTTICAKAAALNFIAEDSFDEDLMRQKSPSSMQRIANAFHFTKQDLLLNRQGKLSKAQLNRQWRRFWVGITIFTVMIVVGGAILGVFLWGTAPEGTFPFLPSKATFIEEGSDYEQLFLFGQIGGIVFVLVIIVAFLGLMNAAARIRQSQLYTYRGQIQVRAGYDDNRLHLLDDDDRRGFDITDAQYNLIDPIAEGRQFAVYYIKTRDGIVSLEPI